MSSWRRIALVPLLFGVGIIAGQTVPRWVPGMAPPAAPRRSGNEPARPPLDASMVATPPREAATTGSAEEPVASAPSTKAISHAIEAGDELLEAGNVVGALKHYEAVAERTRGDVPPTVRLRLALCSEWLGDLKSALADYRLLASGGADRRIQLAAKIGLARAWSQWGHPELARQILWKCLREDSPPETFAAEAANLLARLLAEQAMPKAESGLLADSALATPADDASPSYVLAWLKPRGAGRDAAPGAEGAVKTQVSVVQRLGPMPEAIRMDVALDRMSVFAALRRIADQARIQTQWSTDARGQVAGRTTQINVTDWDAGAIFDSLLDPYELAWKASDTTILVRTQEELEAANRRELRMRLAERALRRSVTLFPEHRLAAAQYWLLGNLQFHQAHPEEALASYRRLLSLFPRTPGTAKVHFNMAKVQWRQGDGEAAVRQWYRAVDESAGEEAVAVAHLFIGRWYVDNDRLQRAIKPLARAASLADHPGHEAAAALTLANVFLMLDNPRAANGVLMDHLPALKKPPYRDQTAFVSALARFRGAQTTRQIDNEGHALVAAISHVRADQFFGLCGYAVLGATLGELELLDTAKDVLREGLDRAGSLAIRDRIAVQLGLCELASGEREQAGRRFRSVAEQPRQGDWKAEAQLQLARLAFEDGHDERCLNLCAQLVASRDQGPRRTRALQLMGQAYQRRGERRLAALCFSGVPQPVATNETERP